MKKVQAFQTDDGVVHYSREEAYKHEALHRLADLVRTEYNADDSVANRLAQFMIDHAEQIVANLINLTSHRPASAE